MSLSYNVIFLRENDDYHKKMVSVLKACIDAGLNSVPEEVADYFDKNYSITDEALEIENTDGYVTEGQDDSQCYYDVNINNLPENVSVIRFTIS